MVEVEIISQKYLRHHPLMPDVAMEWEVVYAKDTSKANGET